MLIIDKEDKHVLMNHLRILRFFYKSQARKFKGNHVGEWFGDSLYSLEDLIQRIAGESIEKNED